jgi:hypothetical protein
VKHELVLYDAGDRKVRWNWFLLIWEHAGKDYALDCIILAAIGIAPPFSDDPMRENARALLGPSFQWHDDGAHAYAIADTYRPEGR